jgi:hypothetical protein
MHEENEMTVTPDQLRAAVADDMAQVLLKHYGTKPMAAVLVWYQEEQQLVNVVSNVPDQTCIALLADAIKISLNLPKAS